MAKKKKLTEAQLKLKKKEYDRKRREKMKSDPTSLERLREKERLKYVKKIEKGQVKPVSELSSREKRLKRKSWKKNSQTYRDKKGVLSKNLARVLDITPPSSPGPYFENIHQNREEQRRLLVIAQRKRQLRRRRAMLYAKMSKLQKALDDEKRKGEKFRKRYQRLAKKCQTSPEANVSELLQNVQVPKTVKKRLIFSEVITRQLTDHYKDQKKHSDKRNFFKVMKPNLLKKNKLLSLAKPFFKHETYKRAGCRKLNTKAMKVKQDVTDFLEKDENSRMCPGKKDFLRHKGQVKQKRLLCDTMKNLHKKFLTTVEYKVSLSTFCKFRPFWITWALVKDRDTCKCVIHANVQLMIQKLYENKALPSCDLTRFLSIITCDVHSTKCLFRKCEGCMNKSMEYYLPQPNKIVTYHKWVYETISYEKDGKMKTVRKPIKKEITISIKQLVKLLEEALPSFFQHIGTIAHQYQTISKLKKNLTENEVLIHIDFSENYSCKYYEEIQAVHFGGARQQITLHTGVLYLRRNDGVKAHTFTSLSENNRHDKMAVWAHLIPVFEWLKNQDLNIHTIHILSDSPVNQYKNKFIFHIVSRHINDLYPETKLFSWHYSEPGHGKGAPDGVGGTLKRTADKAVAEGLDIVNLMSLKNILLERCPSIMLFEVTTADIVGIENLVKQSESIAAFRGTQKIRQFVCADDVLEFRSLSCNDCTGKCNHYHLGYYSSSKNNSVMNRRSKIQTQSASDSGQCSKDIPDENAKGTDPDYNIGDHVIIKWDDETYPGQITSVCEEGALVKCMTRGSKAWKWPTLTDEQLYNWNDVLQKIQPPKLIKRGCFFVREMDKGD